MKEEENPYCEICGHCGEIGCCGIENFINEHIKGKTECKNEDWIVQELLSLCEYQTDIFKENKEIQNKLDKIKEYITSYQSICEIQFGS